MSESSLPLICLMLFFGSGNVWVNACVKAAQTWTVLCMDGMVSACILKLMCSCVGTCECHSMSA